MIRLLFLLSLALIALFGDVNHKHKKIVVAGPFASVSHPVFHMIETNTLKDVADEVEFRLWKNPDELRALAINGEVDFLLVPTNTAAILYNKGVDIQLLNVSIWGILGMVSRDDSLLHLKDFKGKKIAIPFRADMPDIVFSQLLKHQGLDPKKDFELVYVATPMDAMQMLIMRRVDHALLAEPAISMAMRKSKSFPVSLIAPDLYRSVDLQAEWAEIFDTDMDVPQAALAVMGKVKDAGLISRFNEEYTRSLEWYKSNAKEAGELVAKNIDMLEADGVADSIKHVRIKSVNAAQSKEKLEFFFSILEAEDPKSIGGKIPDSKFYYGLE